MPGNSGFIRPNFTPNYKMFNPFVNQNEEKQIKSICVITGENCLKLNTNGNSNINYFNSKIKSAKPSSFSKTNLLLSRNISKEKEEFAAKNQEFNQQYNRNDNEFGLGSKPDIEIQTKIPRNIYSSNPSNAISKVNFKNIKFDYAIKEDKMNRLNYNTGIISPKNSYFIAPNSNIIIADPNSKQSNPNINKKSSSKNRILVKSPKDNLKLEKDLLKDLKETKYDFTKANKKKYSTEKTIPKIFRNYSKTYKQLMKEEDKQYSYMNLLYKTSNPLYN